MWAAQIYFSSGAKRNDDTLDALDLQQGQTPT
jgi:hypothetical protein